MIPATSSFSRTTTAETAKLDHLYDIALFMNELTGNTEGNGRRGGSTRPIAAQSPVGTRKIRDGGWNRLEVPSAEERVARDTQTRSEFPIPNLRDNAEMSDLPNSESRVNTRCSHIPTSTARFAEMTKLDALFTSMFNQENVAP